MIPTFKTYLKESVWGNIRKKSLGQEERKEDSLDNLSMFEFRDYLISIYKPTGQVKNILYDVSHVEYPEDPIASEKIEFPVQFENEYQRFVTLEYSPMKNKFVQSIIVSMALFTKNPDLVAELKKKYVVSETWGTIKPLECEVNYRFFINLIDFILANVKNPTFEKVANESVWGDIRKKSLGQETRIEDDIDYMDRDEFYEYLKATYISRRPNRDIIQIPAGENVITIPFAGGHTYYMMEICYYEGKKKIECVTLQDGLLMYLDADIYSVFHITGHINSEIKVEAYPIDSYEITNSFIVELIDWLLEHSDNKERNLFDKKENIRESVWGSIRKKSLGQEKRMEEDVNLLGIEDFYEYLVNTYKVKNGLNFSDINPMNYDISNYIGKAKYEINIPFVVVSPTSPEYHDLQTLYLTFDKRYKRFTQVETHYDVYKCNPGIVDALSERFRVETSESLRQIDIYPKTGSFKFKNNDIVDLLDILLANVENPTLEKVEKS